MNTTFPPTFSKTPTRERGCLPTHQKRGGSETATSSIWKLLVNRSDIFLASAHGRWFARKEPLTEDLLLSGLHGERSIGLYAVSEDGLSRWVGWDIDDDIQLPRLQELAKHLAPQGHVVFETSRRGGHLFAFHQPTDWRHAHAYGVLLAQGFGLEGVEVIPKHRGLNSLRMPGAIHPKTGVSYPAIDPLTGEIISAITALAAVTPIIIPEVMLPDPEPVLATGSSNLSNWSNKDTFADLVHELEQLTHVRVYASNRGIARCPWHTDRSPSLYLKDNRMHCLSPNCGVWGSATDVRRFTTQGVLPPKG